MHIDFHAFLKRENDKVAIRSITTESQSAAVNLICCTNIKDSPQKALDCIHILTLNQVCFISLSLPADILMVSGV